jgi:hypothetical protein
MQPFMTLDEQLIVYLLVIMFIQPIPDALLPSVIEFVREFPVYLRTVGQCARKTELALWPHLFSVAGRPRALFDECLTRGQLDIAATYLLVIQNLESPTVSRKFATQLMDKALEGRKWDLVKDLTRFLKAIGKYLILK